MDELVSLVKRLGSKAPNNQTLQNKSSSVAKLLLSLGDAVSSEEAVRVYQMFRVTEEKIKIGDGDSAIQTLEQIQVTMDPQIRARASMRTRVLDKLFEGATTVDQAETLTVRLSLASKDSLAGSELQTQLQGFYKELEHFQEKLRFQEPGSPHASILSQASLLRSVLDSETPIDRAAAQAQIENFMVNLEMMRNDMVQGRLLQSEQGSTFSSESVAQDPLDSPKKERGTPSSSWLSDATNVDGPGVREWLDKVYESLGKLGKELKSKPMDAPSVQQSAFESNSELEDGINPGVADLPAKLDFKKSQSIGGKKPGLTIELDSQQGAAVNRDAPKQHPQSTKHLPAVRADKRMSGTRQYTSTGREIGGNLANSEDELDAELENKQQRSAGNEDHDDDDQSLFSNKTPRYFYELRAGEGPSSAVKSALKDFDSIPFFSSNPKQPDYAPQLQQNALQFDQTKQILAKSMTTKQPPVRTSTDFLDPEFRPWFISVVGDPTLADNLELQTERRLLWRRAKFLGVSVGTDTVVRLWLPEGISLPQKDIAFKQGLGETAVVANLLSHLLNSDFLPNGLYSLLGEADPQAGKYTFVLHDPAGERVRVQVDDFLPCVGSATAKFTPNQVAYLGPLTLTGLEGLSDSRVDHVHFLLPCLLEKALARLFGNYLALHRCHTAALLQAVLGPSFYSLKLSNPIPEVVMQGVEKLSSCFVHGTRERRSETLQIAKNTGGQGFQVAGQSFASLHELKHKYDMLYVHGQLPKLGMSKHPYRLTSVKGGLALKLVDASMRQSAYLGLSFKFTSGEGCTQAVYFHELLGSKALDELRSEQGSVLSCSDWTIPWKDLPEEEILFVSKFSPGVELFVDVTDEVAVRELDAAEIAKVKRGIVRKYNNQQPELLKEFFTQSHVVNGSVTFKIHNPEQIKGKLGTLVGALHRKDWMIEHNGTEVALKPTTVLQPVGTKPSGLQQLENVNLLSLEGIDLETLRVYPARRTSWGSVLDKTNQKSLAEQIEQIRLVFN